MNILTKVGQQDNVVTYELMCDTLADMSDIDPKYITLGSVCIVLEGDSDGLEVYMAGSDKRWHNLVSGVSGGSGAASPSNLGSGFTIHLCGQDEVDQDGAPAVSTPADDVLYLVPSGAETGTLYNEFIYKDNQWEPFGVFNSGAGIDWSSLYHTEEIIKETIIYDGNVINENGDTYIGENGEPTIYYNQVSSAIGDSNVINELQVSIDHNDFISLPRNEIDRNTYGDMDPYLATYGIHIDLSRKDDQTYYNIYTLEQFEYITIKYSIDSQVIVANEDFSTAVKNAATTCLKYEGVISSENLLADKGLYILDNEKLGAIRIYNDRDRREIFPILQNMDGEYIQSVITRIDPPTLIDNMYWSYIYDFSNLENGTYTLSSNISETYCYDANGETILHQDLPCTININNNNKVYLLCEYELNEPGGDII